MADRVREAAERVVSVFAESIRRQTGTALLADPIAALADALRDAPARDRVREAAKRVVDEYEAMNEIVMMSELCPRIEALADAFRNAPAPEGVAEPTEQVLPERILLVLVRATLAAQTTYGDGARAAHDEYAVAFTAAMDWYARRGDAGASELVAKHTDDYGPIYERAIARASTSKELAAYRRALDDALASTEAETARADKAEAESRAQKADVERDRARAFAQLWKRSAKRRYGSHLGKMWSEREHLRARVAELEAALRFYADEDNHVDHHDHTEAYWLRCSVVKEDGGERARKALKGGK